MFASEYMNSCNNHIARSIFRHMSFLSYTLMLLKDVMIIINLETLCVETGTWHLRPEW